MDANTFRRLKLYHPSTNKIIAENERRRLENSSKSLKMKSGGSKIAEMSSGGSKITENELQARK